MLFTLSKILLYKYSSSFLNSSYHGRKLISSKKRNRWRWIQKKIRILRSQDIVISNVGQCFTMKTTYYSMLPQMLGIKFSFLLCQDLVPSHLLQKVYKNQLVRQHLNLLKISVPGGPFHSYKKNRDQYKEMKTEE